jgi:hypothetical protein
MGAGSIAPAWPVGVVSAGVGRGLLVHPVKINAALMSARHNFLEIEFIEGTRQE